MSVADKVAYAMSVAERLPANMLKASDGNHAFTTENILPVTLGALESDTRNEFEAICGCYGSGYRSALREGLYHDKGDIPTSQWRKEIRMLYHNIKENIGDLELPSFDIAY